MLLCSASLHAADTLRCGSRLVSLEDLSAQVLAVCGEPTYRDQWYYELPYNRGYAADVEVWTYNFGPSRLLQVLKFRDDRLIDIQSDGYGFYSSAEPHCAPSAVIEGLSKYRLLATCGEPVSKRAENILEPLTAPNGGFGRYGPYGALTPVYRERWVYNFGSSSLLREVTLENGRVTEVRSGARGFDVPADSP